MRVTPVTVGKRVAVQVEDRPIEYGGFEGIISQCQYGGSTVMLWDQGLELQTGHTGTNFPTWQPHLKRNH